MCGLGCRSIYWNYVGFNWSCDLGQCFSDQNNVLARIFRYLLFEPTHEQVSWISLFESDLIMSVMYTYPMWHLNDTWRHRWFLTHVKMDRVEIYPIPLRSFLNLLNPQQHVCSSAIQLWHHISKSLDMECRLYYSVYPWRLGDCYWTNQWEL